MSGHCLKCGTQLEMLWGFCPHCGTESVRGPQEVVPVEHEKAPVQGAFSGLLIGVLAVPILIIPGALLCLTGLGAFLGVPMILVGFFAPLLGPMVGIGTLRGKCPWCATPVNSVIAGEKEFGCIACSKRIAVRHREFVKAA